MNVPDDYLKKAKKTAEKKTTLVKTPTKPSSIEPTYVPAKGTQILVTTSTDVGVRLPKKCKSL